MKGFHGALASNAVCAHPMPLLHKRRGMYLVVVSPRSIAKVVEAHAHVCGFLPLQSVYDAVFVEHGDASGVSKTAELYPLGPILSSISIFDKRS